MDSSTHHPGGRLGGAKLGPASGVVGSAIFFAVLWTTARLVGVQQHLRVFLKARTKVSI